MGEINGDSYEFKVGHEQAGKPVAWVTVEENEGYFLPTVAMATVGENGAHYKAFPVGDGDSRWWRLDTGGFSMPTGGYIAVLKESGAVGSVNTPPSLVSEPRFVEARRDNVSSQNNPIFRLDMSDNTTPGLDENGRYSGYETKGEWYVGDEAIVAGLHAALQAKGIGHAYPALYLYLNYYAHPEAMLLDTEMQGVVATEQFSASSIHSSLLKAYQADGALKEKINDTSVRDVPKLVEEFMDLRRQVAACEDAIAQERAMSYTFAGRIPPAGSYRNGQCMPWTARQEDYAIEISGLLEGNAGSTTKELQRESDELKRRIEYAMWTIEKLTALRSKIEQV